MFIVSLRSSSYGSYNMCPQLYFLNYCLGFRSPANKKACLGNIVHKSLEILALQKMYEQGDINKIIDDGIGKIDPKDITPEWATSKSFAYYVSIEPEIHFTKGDLSTCQEWTRMALDYQGGIFDPRKRNIVTPEKKFEIIIDEPWGQYDYEIDGEKIKGSLNLQGTIDLITRLDKDSIEIIDWKTGSMVDWASPNFARKDYDKFIKDPQLLIYYYAIRNIYKNEKNVVFTIMYIRDGGPTTIGFDDTDYLYAEKLIKDMFETIKKDLRPQLNVGKKCNFCWFNKNKYENSGQSYCRYFEKEVKKNGVDKTFELYGNKKAFGKYMDGGGKKSDENK